MAGKIKLDIAIEDDRWQKAIPNAAEIAEKAISAGFAEANFSESGEICVLLSTDAAIQALNRDYRGMDKPTNVLSFPAEKTPTIPGEPCPLGDVAMAFETLDREARAAILEIYT